jgi:hypothetical protein
MAVQVATLFGTKRLVVTASQYLRTMRTPGLARFGEHKPPTHQDEAG